MADQVLFRPNLWLCQSGRLTAVEPTVLPGHVILVPDCVARYTGWFGSSGHGGNRQRFHVHRWTETGMPQANATASMDGIDGRG